MAQDNPTVLYGESTALAYAVLTAGVPGAYTSITNRVTIDGPSLNRAKVETTTLDNVSFKSFRISNLNEPGELNCKIYFNPSDPTHGLLMGLLVAIPSAATVAWKITFSDGTKYIQVGFVSKYSVTGVKVESNVEADLTITLTGSFNYVPGASGVSPIIGSTSLGTG